MHEAVDVVMQGGHCLELKLTARAMIAVHTQ